MHTETIIDTDATTDTYLTPCTCATGIDADCPRCDVDGADEFDLDTAALLIAAFTGTPAYVEHTGGGCATIYVGPGQDDPRTDLLPVLSVGPGTFGYGATNSTASTLECFIGLDAKMFGDDAASTHCHTVPEHHAAPAAWLAVKAAELWETAQSTPRIAHRWSEV